jgi:hypothetical protein
MISNARSFVRPEHEILTSEVKEHKSLALKIRANFSKIESRGFI